jgi:IS30 family transposase
MPRFGTLQACPQLAAQVSAWLADWWSPVQISRRLRIEHPGDPMIRVSHETIYQALYVQGRGELRRELARCLRTGRARRRPRGRGENTGRIRDMVMISERPAEAADRAVPGHWEGDLINGKDCKSAVGTLVERTTRYVLLLHLPGGRDAHLVEHAMRKAISTLPAGLARTLTWDQGKEMAYHADFTIATGIPVYFCDPHAPWQRGSNENTNGLLRQYLPKGTDLSAHSATDLARIAASLNNRPRKTLRPENRRPQLGARQRRRSRLCGPLVMWSAVRLGGLGDGDGVAEGFELADVIAGLAALVGSGLVVAGSEVVVAGGGVVEQVPDDDQDGSGDGDLGAGGAAAAGEAPVAFAGEGVGAGGGDSGPAQVAPQPGVALAFAGAGAGAGLDGPPA